jgi:hypothetical protein
VARDVNIYRWSFSLRVFSFCDRHLRSQNFHEVNLWSYHSFVTALSAFLYSMTALSYLDSFHVYIRDELVVHDHAVSRA